MQENFGLEAKEQKGSLRLSEDGNRIGDSASDPIAAFAPEWQRLLSDKEFWEAGSTSNMNVKRDGEPIEMLPSKETASGNISKQPKEGGKKKGEEQKGDPEVWSGIIPGKIDKVDIKYPAQDENDGSVGKNDVQNRELESGDDNTFANQKLTRKSTKPRDGSLLETQNPSIEIHLWPSSYGQQSPPTPLSDLYPPLSYEQPSHKCKTKVKLIL